jgi:hypothetical protein
MIGVSSYLEKRDSEHAGLQSWKNIINSDDNIRAKSPSPVESGTRCTGQLPTSTKDAPLKNFIILRNDSLTRS